MAISMPEDDWVATLALASLVTLVLYLLTRTKLGEKKGLYPPFPSASWIDTIAAFSNPSGPAFVLECAQQVGFIFRLKLPMPNGSISVAVGDPVLTKEMLTDPATIKPSDVYGFFDNVTKSASIFTQDDGPLWKNRRKGVSPAFSSQHVRRMNRICSEQTERWIKERLEPMVEAGESFDIAQEMIGLTMGVICESAFEYTPSQQDTDLFLEDLAISLRAFTKFTNPLRKLAGGLMPQVRRARKAADRLQKFSFKVMKAYRDSDHHSTEDTVIGRIINNKTYKDDIERAADVTVFLVGGHDTTGYSIAWTLLELARNPAELVKLRSETLKVPREQWTKTDALRNVVKEGMRLHPVAALGSVRRTGRDFYTASEPRYFIPAGSVVFFSQILQHRNPAVYEKPTRFLPSRWENPSELMQIGFVPFALGARNCVGQRLADAELHSVVARLCADYDFTVEAEGTSDYFLTLKPAGARLKAHRAKK